MTEPRIAVLVPCRDEEAAVGEVVRGFRAAEAEIPLVLMGYLNPILAYGAERFCADAAAAGVDGLLSLIHI